MRDFHHRSSSLSPSSTLTRATTSTSNDSATAGPVAVSTQRETRCSADGSPLATTIAATPTDIDGSSSSRESSVKSVNSCCGDENVGDGGIGNVGVGGNAPSAPPNVVIFSNAATFDNLGFCNTSTSNLMPNASLTVARNSSANSMVGKTYHCQRCLNHGVEIARKGHKRYCQYAACTCDKCVLVEQRKILNREINSEREKNASPGGMDRSEEAMSRVKTRNPKCARCGVHVKHVEPPPLKGHKKNCPYQNCTCRRCTLVTNRRNIMAKQIHLRRSQKAKPSHRQGEKHEHGHGRMIFDNRLNKNFELRRPIDHHRLKTFSPDSIKFLDDQQHARVVSPPRRFYPQRHHFRAPTHFAAAATAQAMLKLSPPQFPPPSALPPNLCGGMPHVAAIQSSPPPQQQHNHYQHYLNPHNQPTSAACKPPPNFLAALVASRLSGVGGAPPINALGLPLNRFAAAAPAPSLSLPVASTANFNGGGEESSTLAAAVAAAAAASATNNSQLLLCAAFLNDFRRAQQQQLAQSLENRLPPIDNRLPPAAALQQRLSEALIAANQANAIRSRDEAKNGAVYNEDGFEGKNGNSGGGNNRCDDALQHRIDWSLLASTFQASLGGALPPDLAFPAAAAAFYAADRLFRVDGATAAAAAGAASAAAASASLPQHYGLYELLLERNGCSTGHRHPALLGFMPQASPPAMLSTPEGVFPMGLPMLRSLAETMQI